MGVYHIMGLGRSPGAITAPLSYLAYRYKRWNNDDQRFFARSGEITQRKRGEKVGDVQALVLFTTPEVLRANDSRFYSYEYIENPSGRITEKPVLPGGSMKEVLQKLLRKEWPGVSGGREEGIIFWCEVDRRDIRSTYDRIIQVIAALAGVGGQGKEIWVNLTSGNNVTNFALELAATLSGNVARLYYVQAENQSAEKCIRFTAEVGYWVDLPVMPLKLSDVSHAIIELLLQESSMSLQNLYSRLKSIHWKPLQGVSTETFEEVYLKPMWKQGLIAEKTAKTYEIGPQWELIHPYEEVLQQAQRSQRTIEELAQQENWIECELLRFH